MSATKIASVNGDLGIFAHKPVQTSVLGTIGTANKPTALVEQMIWNF